MIDLSVPIVFDKIGFAVSFIANFLVIYLTIFHIKKMSMTYKEMIIMFAIYGILFTSIEVIARPFSHNYNKAIMFFSLNTYLPRDTVRIFLASWGGLYLVVLAFISIQFTYRFLCLFHVNKAKKFDRMVSEICICYPFITGGFYCFSFYLFCIPDEYSDDFMKDVIFDNYGLVIGDLARFIMIPYASDNSIRWRNLLFFVSAIFLIWFHYSIIFYCGLKMHLNMKQALAKFSVKNRKLQQQFFYALVVQTLGPTVCLVIPAIPILFAPLLHPYLHLDHNWRTGWLYSLMGLYPPFDSIAFMVIVSEYRKVITSQLGYLFSRKSVRKSGSNNTVPKSPPGLELSKI